MYKVFDQTLSSLMEVCEKSPDQVARKKNLLVVFRFVNQNIPFLLLNWFRYRTFAHMVCSKIDQIFLVDFYTSSPECQFLKEIKFKLDDPVRCRSRCRDDNRCSRHVYLNQILCWQHKDKFNDLRQVVQKHLDPGSTSIVMKYVWEYGTKK